MVTNSYEKTCDHPVNFTRRYHGDHFTGRLSARSTGVGSSDFSHALTRLTGPPSTLSSFSSVMYSSSARLEFGSEFEPISNEELDTVLQVVHMLVVQFL